MTETVTPLAARAAPVRLRGLTKRFGRDVLAVDAIDLDIETGELVTLLGPSGCGKTTTLRMIAGLEEPSGGSIRLGDVDVTREPPNRRDITMVFQSYALFPHMNVFHNVAYGLTVARRPRAEVLARVAEALELVGMAELSERPVNALSGGQQQRVALARSLVLNPSVILFDEPLSNLDAKLRKRVREDIRSLQQRLGITTIYVTHDQEEALAISDRVVVMHEGRIEQIGAPRDLYHRPETPFVADFIGAANLLPGRFDGVTVSVGEHGFPHAQAMRTGDVAVMVRPEAVRIAAEGLRAVVLRSSFLGASTEVVFETSGGALEAALPDSVAAELRPGQEVRLAFDALGVHLLEPTGVGSGTS